MASLMSPTILNILRNVLSSSTPQGIGFLPYRFSSLSVTHPCQVVQLKQLQNVQLNHVSLLIAPGFLQHK